jgi:chemosensory pili system protein ChpA (sensor histidine kinase/response regulator)
VPSRSKPLILVVDDDDATREAFSLILALDGFRVQTAFDGLDALERLNSGERPHLIILDLMMPRVDGFQVCQHLGDDPRLAGVPVVVCTASGRKARELPSAPAALLQKPVDPADLLAAVRRALPVEHSSVMSQ